MAPETTTREEELTNLFGKNRAINVRSVRSRQFHKTRKALMQGKPGEKPPTEHQKARWNFQANRGQNFSQASTSKNEDPGKFWETLYSTEYISKNY